MEEASEEELKALLQEIEMLERVRCDTAPRKGESKSLCELLSCAMAVASQSLGKILARARGDTRISP